MSDFKFTISFCNFFFIFLIVIKWYILIVIITSKRYSKRLPGIMESKLAEHEKACGVRNSTNESHYDLNILKEGKTKFTDGWNTVFAKQCTCFCLYRHP